MLTRYFKKRDNPWEILAIAFCFFGPGLALLLYNGPALLLRHGSRARASRISFTPLEVHVFGWWAVTVAAVLLVLYFYARWTNTREPENSTPMITVANYYNIHEALRLQMILGTADIPSFIPDEVTAQNAPYVFLGSEAGVRVQVAEEHASEARQIIVNSREIPEIHHDENKANPDKEGQNEEEEHC